MTFLENETYSDRRTLYTVASLSILILILVIIGLLSHRPMNDNGNPVWKSAPYGDPQDTGRLKAGR
jgi:hypothetical protein